MLELLLIRHGQTDGNVEQIVMGRKPFPLNETGREQARRLSVYLKNVTFEKVITSPVKRAKETAEILLHERSQHLLHEDDRLAEIDYGEWVDQSFHLIHEKYIDLWKQYEDDPTQLLFPGGEAFQDVSLRVGSLIDTLCEKHTHGSIALVSHADVIKLALIHLLKLPLQVLKQFSIENCSVSLVRMHPQYGPRLVQYNAFHGFGNEHS